MGKKKTSTACAYCKNGHGLIKVNGQPIEHIQPEAFRLQVYEPILILGTDKFSNVDIRVRSRAEELLPKSTLFAQPSLSPSWRTTPNMLMKPVRMRFGKSCSTMTGTCW